YQLGIRLGVDRLATWAHKVGLGQKTGIDLPQERAGFIPTSRFYDARRGAGAWGRGVVLNLAIGQGENLTTPLPLAQLAGAIASRGRLARVHAVDALVDPETGVVQPVRFAPPTALKLPEDIWYALVEVMEGGGCPGTDGG